MSVEDLSTAPGLTAAEVAERVAAGQTNAAPPKSGRSIGDIIRANVFTRINAILGVLFVIVAYTGSFINGLFGLMIIANSGIGIIQEIRAKLTLDKLAIVGQTRPTVRRDGVVAQIPADEVVVDDIIELGPGDQVVVDGVTVESQSLDVDESLLTGEADAVDKAPGDEILSGSFAVSGSGAYRATKVGADAYAAQLAAEAAKFTLVSSELRTGIDKILRVITYLLIPAGILTIVNQLFISKAALDDALLGMVAALVPMVPEGLVLLTSIAFAVGVIRLGRRQCLVNELPAIEGLARVNVVCTDKTGTLTENGMRLAEVRRLDSAPEELTASRIETALSALAAHDPRPNASIEALIEAFPDAANWSVTSLLPFSSANKFSGMSFDDETGADAGNWLIGAPDVLLDPADPAAQLASDLGATGLRILLAAVTDVPVATEAGPGAPGNPVPVALIVLEQRVRPDAGETLDFFERQDVAVKVISGDNALSVGAVASSLGLGTPDDSVDARKLPEDQGELGQVVTDHVAFGRVRPDQKRAMVGALQARGDTVAMTGDGVNDVLALKDADIGVAMGSGSSAARSVAQIVLLDNKFATLPYVVAEGRRVIGNIERVANLFLTKTVYAVLLALMIGCAGVIAEVFDLTTISYPFRPIHVTISAWFTIGIPSFILSLAPNYERARTGFVRRVLTQAVPNGIIVGLATFICYYLVNPGGGGEVLGGGSHTVTAWTPEQTQASTAALITMIGGALWVLVMVARPYNWWKILLLIASALGYVIIFGWSWTQQLFQLDPTNMRITSVGLVCLAVSIVALEVVNRIVVHFTGGRTADDGAEDFQQQRTPEPHPAA